MAIPADMDVIPRDLTVAHMMQFVQNRAERALEVLREIIDMPDVPEGGLTSPNWLLAQQSQAVSPFMGGAGNMLGGIPPANNITWADNTASTQMRRGFNG